MMHIGVQRASAPFTLEVEADQDPNHEYDLSLYTKYDALMKPELLTHFVKRLAAAIPGVGRPNAVRINAIDKARNGDASVKWSLVAATKCQRDRFKQIHKAMDYGSRDVRREFRERMGSRLNPKKVSAL